MTTVHPGAVDADVHVAPRGISDLLPYLDPYWHEYLAGGRIELSPGLSGAYPPGAPTSATPEARAAGSFPPRRYDSLKREVLDRCEPRAVILNCLSAFDASRNLYYQAALSTAVNDWLRDEWLDRDDRIRASIVVPSLDPEAAADEIERRAGDRRFVQVLLPVRSETPWGNKRWRPIFAAAARHGLPVALHAWGAYGLSATTTGYSRTYLEDYLANSQFIAPTQVISLISEGVFEAYPSLRVSLVECGFTWVPSLLWRSDKDWKALWREVPWVTARPSEYFHRYFRATTAPAQLPPSVPDEQIEQLAAMLGASEVLLYSSDYPHDHGDDGFERLLSVLGEGGRRAVLETNAAALYGLDDALGAS